MAYYAEIKDGIVVRVLAVSNGVEVAGGEQSCIEFCKSIAGGDTWVKTSFNNNIRKQFAGIGDTYDAEKDKFIRPQPFASWALDSNDDWQPPVERPSDFATKSYSWNEADKKWIEG